MGIDVRMRIDERQPMQFVSQPTSQFNRHVFPCVLCVVNEKGERWALAQW
jgi:hypothetical protein